MILIFEEREVSVLYREAVTSSLEPPQEKYRGPDFQNLRATIGHYDSDHELQGFF